MFTVFAWTWLPEFCICWTKVRIVLRIYKGFPPMSTTTICVCQEWNTEKVFPRLKKKKEICFSDNIPFQSNGESKHCFIIILRHKKCCWVGVLSFLMMHQLSFALERYFEQCPKEMVFFFGMPYLIGLSWYYVKFGHCQNSASCCIVSFACWDLFDDRGALNLPSDTVNSPICGTRPIPLYKQQCKHL